MKYTKHIRRRVVFQANQVQRKVFHGSPGCKVHYIKTVWKHYRIFGHPREACSANDNRLSLNDLRHRDECRRQQRALIGTDKEVAR